VDLLNSRAETLQSELEKSTKALKVSEERITDLSDSLAIKYDIRQSVSLLEGESHMILDGAAIIGLQSSYNNRAVITLQNETEFLDVGSVSEIKVEDARCIVALRRTSMYEGSDFDLICRSEKTNLARNKFFHQRHLFTASRSHGALSLSQVAEEVGFPLFLRAPSQGQQKSSACSEGPEGPALLPLKPFDDLTVLTKSAT